MIRLGAVGFGAIARRYVAASIRLGTARIVAATDPSPFARAQALASDCKAYASAEAMFDAEELDAVLVLSPNALHPQHVRAALGRGLDVLCEKPLAIDSAEASRLLREAGARDRLLYAAMHCRFRPEISFMLERGVDGVTGFAHYYEEDWHRAPSWYFDLATVGGGVTLDVGINQLDWLSLLLGTAVPTRAVFGVGDGVDFTSRIHWRVGNTNGETQWSWRATRERKETHLYSSSGTYILDHMRHLVRHTKVQYGPWENREYELVLADFVAQIKGERARTPCNAPMLLDRLAAAYSLGGLNLLSAGAGVREELRV